MEYDDSVGYYGNWRVSCSVEDAYQHNLNDECNDRTRLMRIFHVSRLVLR